MRPSKVVWSSGVIFSACTSNVLDRRGHWVRPALPEPSMPGKKSRIGSVSRFGVRRSKEKLETGAAATIRGVRTPRRGNVPSKNVRPRRVEAVIIVRTFLEKSHVSHVPVT